MHTAGETVVYVGSLMDTSHPRLFINADPAGGRSLDDVSSAKAAEIEGIMGKAAMWSLGMMLDGVPANRFDRVPGQVLSRQVLLVRGNRLYTLTFIPDDPDVAGVYEEMQLLYELVMESFSFLDRLVLPDSVRSGRERAMSRSAARARFTFQTATATAA